MVLSMVVDVISVEKKKEKKVKFCPIMWAVV